MNFAETLRKKTDEINVTKKEVVDEIVDKFNDYLNNGKFENYLKKIITDSDLEKGYKILYSEFWQYQSGCTKTRFYIVGWEWCNKEVPDYSYEQDFYKGFRLKDIHEEVIMQCLNVLKDFLETNGFHHRVTSERNRFKELRGEIVISW